jgi:opacity protein-like surface antigen
MKKINKQGMKMNKSIAIMITCGALVSHLVSFSAIATDEESYAFVGFGLSHYDNFANLAISETQIDLVPEVYLGVGQRYQLNDDWQLATEVSIHYAKAYFSGLAENVDANHLSKELQVSSGNYQSLGLWATSRFNYVSLSDNVSPFIELALGAVQTNQSALFGEEKNQQIAYKAIAGLEFEVADKMTFSIGVGLSDNDDHL